MFRKILIANRGEIACRVIATARRMGIFTVAVYSEADANARHVELADEAFLIGPAPARQSYLRADIILDVARGAGAEAIHPGYGFLSENADFAEACAHADIVFIGPPAAAIRAMGSKAAAKTLMEKSGVPLVPGYHGADQSVAKIEAEAEKIGYPVLLKASSGGGGRGMRVVEHAAQLADAVDRARGEARASFGDDHLLVEKYLTKPRHIEVQVFGDRHGQIVSLFERDCSIQRRHQKVFEESPAPGITPEQRQALSEAAIAAAKAVDYVGAGTVEFIYEDDRFYFMEMNTRLQVEHPVTELVTGTDLVEWQFRVAAGEKLPCDAADLHMRGHAIEVRICAEDPAQDFRPATGKVLLLRQPEQTAHVRIDTGVREGDTITPNYDSMIAKLIVWDADRSAALRRLSRALDQYELAGPHTNLDLLRNIAAHPDYAQGGVDTGFIARHPEVLAAAAIPDERPVWAAACLSLLDVGASQPAGDPWSPWGVSDGHWLNGGMAARLEICRGDEAALSVSARKQGALWELDLPGGPAAARFERGRAGAPDLIVIDGARMAIRTLVRGNTVTVIRRGRNQVFTRLDGFAPDMREDAAVGRLMAPTPGRVVAVFAKAGGKVARGDKLLILEAMKVETVFTAPRDGVIEAVHVVADEQIQEGAKLVTYRAEVTAGAGS